MLATPDGKGGAAIAGDPEHPANFGRLCSKGSALGETLGLETRLLHPDDRRRGASGWDDALDHVAGGLRASRPAHGPEAIAFYLSGQLLTEDYYVANKLAKGFIGTPHVDTNSRLCMASSVAGHRRAFGADIVPQCYDDLELADLVVLVGSNAAWCHPVLYQRIQMARAERGVRVVNIDPRRTATSEGADLHLPIKPGTDAQLWNGLLLLARRARRARPALHRRAHAKALRRRSARARMQAGRVAAGRARHRPRQRATSSSSIGWWTARARVVTCYSQGVNQSAQGTDKVNAIINCHLATGRIGKPGSGPLSLTGQPNAMGGREVGGLANMLAAHMGFSAAERDRVRRFWDAPNLVAGEGLKAVRDVRRRRRRPHQGAVGDGHQPGRQPAARRRTCARRCGELELLVVSENVASNDTVEPGARAAAGGGVGREGRHGHQLRAAHLAPARVPAAAGRGAARLVDPERRSRARLGWAEAFSYRSAADIFREHARLSGFENDGERAVRHLRSRRPERRALRRA